MGTIVRALVADLDVAVHVANDTATDPWDPSCVLRRVVIAASYSCASWMSTWPCHLSGVCLFGQLGLGLEPHVLDSHGFPCLQTAPGLL